MSALKKSQDSLTEFWRESLGISDQKPQTSESLSKSSSAFNLKIGEYIRISPTDELPDEGSLVNHPQRYREYVAQKNQFRPGWGKIVKTYTDKLKSAKDMNRPAFIDMCRAIKNEEINAIICTELSRISRSVRDFVQFWEFLKKHNVKLILVNSFIDTSDFMGEYWLYQEINNAEMERKRTIHRIRSGHLSRANRGLTSGGARILGYDPDPDKRCHLVVNKKEAKYINLIFDQFLELGSVAKLANFLNENGFQTKQFVARSSGKRKGGNRWTNTSLQSLLTNLTYVGLREINKKHRNKDQTKLDKDYRYKVTEAHWPAIVDNETFLTVQKTIQKNRKFSRSYIHNYILTGLLTCIHCGEQLVGMSSQGRSKNYYYYGHRRKMLAKGNRHKERCHTERYPASALEEIVLSKINHLSHDDNSLKKLVEAANGDQSLPFKSIISELQSKQHRFRSIQVEIKNLIQLASQTDKQPKAKQAFLEQIESFTKEKELLESKITELHERKKVVHSQTIDIEEIKKIFKNFSQKIQKLTAHQKKEAVWSLVRSVKVSTELVTVELYGGHQPFFKKSNNLDNLINLNDNNKCMMNSESNRDVYKHISSPPTPVLYEPPYVTVNIKFCVKPLLRDQEIFADLYLLKNQSIKQIADTLGIGKTAVLKRLHRMGIRPGSGSRLTHPENYRGNNPPFGYQVSPTGQLEFRPREIDICRKIIFYRDHHQFPFLKIAKTFTEQKIKNRAGSCKWHSGNLSRIYNVWKPKLEQLGGEL